MYIIIKYVIIILILRSWANTKTKVILNSISLIFQFMLFHFTLCVIKKLFVPFGHVIVRTNEIIWLIHIHRNVSHGWGKWLH